MRGTPYAASVIDRNCALQPCFSSLQDRRLAAFIAARQIKISAAIEPISSIFVSLTPAPRWIYFHEVQMTKFLVTAAMFSALAVTSASAKPMMMGCSGDGMMKMNNMTTAMADGDQKMMMNREIGMANTAMSKGDMRGCNMHMMKAQKMSMMKPKNDMGGGMMMMPMMGDRKM
jgi:hypothetical protein